MASNPLLGIVAGAVGTAALNIATYGDMAVRGRPASSVPDDLAGAMADQLGIDLVTKNGKSDKKVEKNRRTGIGALMGYVTGLGVGALYGVARPYLPDVPTPLLAVGVAVAAMTTSDVPATVFGVTDPTTWSGTDWALDFGFHLVYGIATVLTYEALDKG